MKSFHTFVITGAAAAAFAQTPPVPAPKAPSSASSLLAPPAAATAKPVPSDPNQVILTIGDEKMTLGQYNALVDTLPAQYQTAARGPQKRQIAERLAQLRIMSKEAEKRNIDKTPAVKEQLAFQRENILANALYQEFAKNAKIDDATARKYYDDHKSEYETATGRHILIRYKGSAVPLRPGSKELTEDEALAKAQEVRKKLEAGADFATLAKAESDDTGSGANGGDLGTFKHGQMVPAFEQAAFALPVGKLSEPVKTQFGYHLIKLDKKESKTFEEAKPEITEKLGPEIAKKQADDLRNSSKVTFDEAFFGPAAAAQ
ncbi:MAG: peptidylprolyl isomerase [Acidobacteriota bacterium]|nr:peptidylprolyl isomerase [Acidobacteriota bacterium]